MNIEGGEKMKKRFLATIVILSCLLPVQNIFADGIVRPPKGVDVQGAKLVSEGAYFYIKVTNNRGEAVNITMHTPIMFEEFKQYSTSNSSIGDSVVPFSLNSGDSVYFHFHAPSISGAYKFFIISFYINNEGENRFVVYVVDRTTTLSELGVYGPKLKNKEAESPEPEVPTAVEKYFAFKLSALTMLSLLVSFVAVVAVAAILGYMYGEKKWRR